MPTALISGASIAGPAVAYWLQRTGWTVTVVERAPALRRGGQAVDIRGTALQVVERMGLHPEVAALHTKMRGMSFVDAEGNVLMSSTEETLTGGVIDSPDIEILRDDLAELLHSATADRVEYLFGDTITGIDQSGDRAVVTFEHAESREFDLVVGADGLHSRVRALTFGEESRFRSDLGTYVAMFSLDNHLDLDHWQTFHQAEGTMVGIYSARDNTEARGMLGFEGTDIDYDFRDVDAQRELVAARFADNTGWETPALLRAMWTAPDFHFDSFSQIKMDTWSRGRVTLVGDAGYCPSPLSGQGTSLALVGAYLLAAELAKTDLSAAGLETAFAACETRMRPFIDSCMRLATDTPGQPPSPETMRAAANGISLDEPEPAR
ncbi:FAD-dependent monooxygenase [Actinokineospora auranticolor]|uniref:2-polyprenyl-6-methoxyphenol hydroxylase-like FAD-dependent oxidoreductase n=1 Tax=Actinokineospora auranticolor TaxID=155976 RepID=A0A2S6GW60_9PSEU|nr:FAD-dependent monooxygenase [Actinokineospora auranticolor]PPK69437.1 2-polyprenyl-6-methoxyphenol hydroxylase-like FAD-dependent oxidoreductase [Actinokineospora auranticolor]